MTDGPPQGLRYTHAYVERGAPGPITPTARSRLAALVLALPEPRDLEREVEREMGLMVFDWRFFFAKQISDEQLLDLITVIRKWLAKKVQSSLYFPDRAAPVDWVDDVNRIFRQENIHYHVDPVGGVHPCR
jgi:hypothetical protein